MSKIAEKRVVVARIGAPHGVRGEVRVQPFTEDPMALKDFSPLHVAGKPQMLSALSVRPQKNMLVVRFKEVTSREAAEALKGALLEVERNRLPDEELDDDEFYITDLVGLDVQDGQGDLIGTVVAVENFGAGDIVEIKPIRGHALMLAFTEANVPKIDLEAGFIIIDPPEELDAGGKERA
jgi:16S rRNA processing protein RimM